MIPGIFKGECGQALGLSQKMSVRGFASMVAVAGLLSAANVAHAADAKGKGIDFTVRTEPSSVAAAGGKTLKWDARKGHWGLMLNLEQPETRASNWNDVQAGAYYRITPSLRVGGAVAMGDQQVVAAPRQPLPGDGAPRVRLETAFKF
jgi:hypothetical protein